MKITVDINETEKRRLVDQPCYTAEELTLAHKDLHHGYRGGTLIEDLTAQVRKNRLMHLHES